MHKRKRKILMWRRKNKKIDLENPPTLNITVHDVLKGVDAGPGQL